MQTPRVTEITAVPYHRPHGPGHHGPCAACQRAAQQQQSQQLAEAQAAATRWAALPAWQLRMGRLPTL